MWDDKYGPDSLYAQIEKQKARAIQEQAEWEATMRRHHQRRMDHINSLLAESFSNTNRIGTSKKTGWF